MKKLVSIAAMALSAALFTSAANAADVTLRFHQFLSLKADIPAQGIAPWIKKIEEESNGRIKIEHYPSMQLGGSPPSLYGILISCPNNISNRFLVVSFFQTPG